MEFSGDHSWFQVADNGRGMNRDELNEGMRFGTEREYKPNELGKFGLGMKTASISQCRKVTVASRNNYPAGDIEIRQLNLDLIEETNRWEIVSIPKEDYSEAMWVSLLDHSGTVVQWENLDRMLQYDPPDGMRARSGFMRLIRELEEHLSMVFHRFLSGEIEGGKKLEISINGVKLEAWDPFARSERNTMKLNASTVPIVGSSGLFSVHVSPYVLPSKEKFSSTEAFKRSSGPSKWNAQQGFYIYRNNRMIQAGGWCRMRTADEHTKLARIALDLDSRSDSSLGLNIMKSSIIFPENMKKSLSEIVDNTVKLARKAYTPEGKTEKPHTNLNDGTMTNRSRSVSSNSVPQRDLTHVNIRAAKDEAEPKHLTDHSTAWVQTPGEILERVAEIVGESQALTKIKNVIVMQNPDIARMLGW